MNLDDVMNQSISYSPGVFDRAEFWYGDASGAPFTSRSTGLTEVVDQIEYRTAQGVPDGGTTLVLLGFALTGLGALRRKFVT